MTSMRWHGAPPYCVAVLHGGPGAAGDVEPVARELGRHRGILEPYQTELSVGGQVEELRSLLVGQGEPPLALVGHSWGAWLGLLLAARHPILVRKLVLVGCGPLAEEHAAGLQEARAGRLAAGERAEFESLIGRLSRAAGAEKDALLDRLGALAAKADVFDPLPVRQGEEPAPHLPGGPAQRRGLIFERVWAEASALRRSGGLMAEAARVRCPVVALHGDHDPHPAEGVRGPLAAALRDFRFVLLEKCGHSPWRERWAREDFFRILGLELDA